MERDGVGLASDMAGDDGDGAELSHGPGVAKDDAAEERPFDIGEGDAPEGLPTVGSEGDGGLFLGVSLSLHQRNDLTCDEGEGHKNSGQDETG